MLEAILSGGFAGLVSLVHCAGMCGPLAAAACLGQRSRAAVLRYQLGRSLSYAFVGSLAARFGTALGLAGERAVWPGVLAGVGALAFAAIGLSAARRTWGKPALIRLRTRAPARRAGPWSALLRVVPREPLSYGLLSALLPCGALAAALMLAAATASPLHGAATMLAFATCSGAGVLFGGWFLQRVSALGGRVLPRAVVVLLAVLALVAVIRPLYLARAAAAEPQPEHSAPSCH